MITDIKINVINEGIIEKIVKELDGTNVARSEEYLYQCLEENERNERITFIAIRNMDIAGMASVIYKSDYPFFRQNGIPEINDLLVHPKHRNHGVGLSLIRKAEETASMLYSYIGLGVGLYRDYGSAQRLYVKNGYIPDGNGMAYKNKEIKPGSHVFVDDDLLIYLYKRL